MGHSYRLFGLTAETNVALPGMRALSSPAVPDVHLWLGVPPPESTAEETSSSPRYVSAGRDQRGEPAVQVWEQQGGAHFEFRYADGTAFTVDRAATRVWATWAAASTLEDTCTYLFGPVFGFLLRLRGITSLHASAVTVDGRAILLVGAAGAGKSTTATVFAREGYGVISDDVAPLLERGAQIFVQPTHPHLRLWPEAVESLFGSPQALPRLTPTWEKRYFDLDTPGCRFEDAPRPLSAVYLLGQREAGDAPRIETVPPREALLELVSNTYVNYLLDREMRAREFLLLGRIVERVPVRRVVPHADPQHAPAMCRLIAADVQRLAAGATRVAG